MNGQALGLWCPVKMRTQSTSSPKAREETPHARVSRDSPYRVSPLPNSPALAPCEPDNPEARMLRSCFPPPNNAHHSGTMHRRSRFPLLPQTPRRDCVARESARRSIGSGSLALALWCFDSVSTCGRLRTRSAGRTRELRRRVVCRRLLRVEMLYAMLELVKNPPHDAQPCAPAGPHGFKD